MSGYNSTSSGTESDSPGADGPAGKQTAETPVQHDEQARPREYGGRRKGLDPTRYGDWEKDGRCIDF